MFCTRRKVRGKKRNGTKTSRFLDKDSNKKGSSEKILELVFKHSHSFHDRERAFELRKTVFLISKIDPPGKCIVNFRVKKTRRFFVCDTFFFATNKTNTKQLASWTGVCLASPWHYVCCFSQFVLCPSWVKDLFHRFRERFQRVQELLTRVPPQDWRQVLRKPATKNLEVVRPCFVAHFLEKCPKRYFHSQKWWLFHTFSWWWSKHEI